MATITVESDIKMAATAGLNVMPIGASIPAAIGIAIKLYPAPKQDFLSSYVWSSEPTR